jgi:hypothetical protein
LENMTAKKTTMTDVADVVLATRKSASPTRRYRLWLTLALPAIVMVLGLDVAAAHVVHKITARTQRAAGAVEETYRIASPIYHHDLAVKADVPDAVWGPLRYPVKTNSLGFKDRSTRDVPLVAGERRILFIGDSFTEGLGYAYEDTFVGLVDDALRPEGFEVLNAAVSSYSPTIYYAKIAYLLETIGLRVDEVVVYLDISDAQDDAVCYAFDAQGRVVDRPARHSADAALDALRRSSVERVLDERTLLLKTIVFSLREGQLRLMRDDAAAARVFWRAAWTFDQRAFDEYGRVGLLRMTENMDRLAQLLARHHVPLTIAVYPWPAQIMFDEIESRQVTHWREWAARRRAGFIDYFPDFIQPSDRRAAVDAYYIPGDVHHNKAGHALLARRFLEYRRSVVLAP